MLEAWRCSSWPSGGDHLLVLLPLSHGGCGGGVLAAGAAVDAAPVGHLTTAATNAIDRFGEFVHECLFSTHAWAELPNTGYFSPIL